MEYEDSVYLEIQNQMNKKSKMRSDYLLLWLIAILLIPFLCFFFVRKPHEYVSDINNLPEPTQIETSWWIVKVVNWQNIHIDFLAEYQVQGRVLAKKSYTELFADNEIVNKMWPRDFVLGWWVMWDEKNMDKFSRWEYGNRVVYGVIKRDYYNRFTETFSWKWESDPVTFRTSFSNNHPIWSTQKIRLLMKKIKVWDVIRFKWYLVYIYPEFWYWWWWPSSMVRDDHGCEIIYVTDIIWLREK